MIATYSETENKAIKWEVDMNCAAYVCEQNQNQWQRGQIIRIVSEKVVEVNFKKLFQMQNSSL